MSYVMRREPRAMLATFIHVEHLDELGRFTDAYFTVFMLYELEAPEDVGRAFVMSSYAPPATFMLQLEYDDDFRLLPSATDGLDARGLALHFVERYVTRHPHPPDADPRYRSRHDRVIEEP